MNRLIFLLVLLLTLVSCRTTKQITEKQSVRIDTVYQHRTDTLLRYQTLLDSIFVHDSISTFIKGDTVIINKEHIRYKYKVLHDSIYITAKDTAVSKSAVSSSQSDNKIIYKETPLLTRIFYAVAFMLIGAFSFWLYKKISTLRTS